MEKQVIDTDRAIEVDGNIWFWVKGYNGLFEMDERTGRVKYVASLPEHYFFKDDLFIAIEKVDDYIVLASKTGAIKIAVYHLKTHEWKVLGLGDNPFGDKYSESLFGFIECISYEKYVYIIGHMVPLIIQLNLETFEIKYVTEWMSDIDIDALPEKVESNYWNASGLQKNYIPTIFFTRGSVSGHMAYFPMRCGNWVLELDMEKAKSRLIVIPTCVEAFNEGSVIGNELWLMGCYQHVIVIYNLINHSVIEVLLEGNAEPTETKGALFYRPIDCGERVLAFPISAGNAYWIDKQTKEFDVYPEWIINRTRETHSMLIKKIIMTKESKVYYISTLNNKWGVFDISSGDEKEIEMEFEEAVKMGEWKVRHRYPVKENEKDVLKEYIKMIGKI